MSNHISWLDILFIGSVYGGRIPITKFFMNNRCTFDMPAWIAWTAKIIPTHGVELAWLDEFPNGEVGNVAFFWVEFDAGTSHEVVEVEMGKFGPFSGCFRGENGWRVV